MLRPPKGCSKLKRHAVLDSSMAFATDGFVDLVDDLLGVSDANEVESGDDATPRSSPLHLVIAGDVDGLAELLKANNEFPVNARNPQTGRSLLHEACARGQHGIVKLLLQKTDTDLMLRTMLGRCTALHIAVTNNYRPIVFLLLSHGADASSRDRFGCSPMHYVKSLSIAKLLVQYGGKVLDSNAKKKHAVESVAKCAAAYQKDRSASVEKREAAATAHRALLKYLEGQAETEYRTKLEGLRQLKKQTKEDGAARTASVPRKTRSRRRMSTNSSSP